MHVLLRLSIVLGLAGCTSRAGGDGTTGRDAAPDRARDAGARDSLVDAPAPDAAATPDAGCACPEIAAPVCGVDGVTYDNLCFAQCAGAAVACVRSGCPCPDGCGLCVSDEDCYPGQYCNAADVCLSWCDCPTCGVCAGHCIAPTTCALMECESGYACRCGGAGPGPHLCQCGLECDDNTDCVDPGQDTCCETSCTDLCTCYCR